MIESIHSLFQRTTLELQIMETGDYNGIYIDINEDELDGNSSEYIIKIAEFMKTHKFLRLYENLKIIGSFHVEPRNMKRNILIRNCISFVNMLKI